VASAVKKGLTKEVQREKFNLEAEHRAFMNKAVFLDRDGVLNDELGRYVLRIEDFRVSAGVAEALQNLKAAGYFLIVVTNQAGIAKGLYERQLVEQCHKILQEQTGNLIDALYYSPHHPDLNTESLLRKPDSLMLEKGAARFKVSLSDSWMVGDKERDMLAGKKAGSRNIYIQHPDFQDEAAASLADFTAHNLLEASRFILSEKH
jgi:D-glycero-D-manno-heptose 1,7-bisphosphate phosphatase